MTSFSDKVKTRPVLVHGSTSVKMLSSGTEQTSSSGYLNEFDGPLG